MRVWLLFCLAIASCAYQPTEEMKQSTLEKPKPAIRAQLVPGTTYGNVVLQGETIEAAKNIFAAKAVMPDCKMEVSHTWPLGSPAPSEYSDEFLRWKELWTFETCGSSVDAEIVYMLHRKSGIINLRVLPLAKGQAVSPPEFS